ncbi:MAG: hypothetical protein WC569_03360 [Candidatus Omnitrophota bacterium]
MMRNLLAAGLIALFVFAAAHAFADGCCSGKKVCTCAQCTSATCGTGACECGCGK